MATTKKRTTTLTQRTIFEREIKIRQEKNGSFMLVSYEQSTAPIGDAYCFTTIDDLMQFLSEQAEIVGAN